jgi:hypothetical protein
MRTSLLFPSRAEARNFTAERLTLARDVTQDFEVGHMDPCWSSCLMAG